MQPSEGSVDLVSGIIDDARDLLEAHVDAIRDDMSLRVATLSSLLIAIGVFIVTAMLLGLAIATTLVAVGLPWWAACWIVTGIAGAIGVGFVFRARAKRQQTKESTP